MSAPEFAVTSLDEVADERKSTRLALLILASVFLIITSWNLQLQTIANPDEPRYAVAAREMIRGGSWMVPRFNAAPRLVKPILFYWLIGAAGMAGQAMGIALDTAFRFGPLLMGLLAVAGTYLLGKELAGLRVGFIAAVVLMTSRYFHLSSRELVVDMTLTALLFWSVLFAWWAVKRLDHDENAFWPFLGFYVCAGLSFMTKGPPVALNVVIPLVVFLFWSGRGMHLFKAGLWWGVPLALAIGLWWFVYLHLSGEISVWEIISKESVGRAVGAKDHQQYLPFWFYLRDLGEHFMPWIVLVPFVGWWSVKKFRALKQTGSDEIPVPVERATNNSANDFSHNTGGIGGEFHKKFNWPKIQDGPRFLFCMLAIPFCLWGIIVSKRALYILPLYPFLALWVAWVWDRAFLCAEGTPAPKKWNIALIAAAVGAIACAAAAVLYADKLRATAPDLVVLGVMSAGIALLFLVASRTLRSGQRYKASLQVLAAAGALCIVFEGFERPIRERNLDSVHFYRTICERLNGRPMVMLGESSNEAVWYLDRPKEVLDDIRMPDLKARFFEAPGTILVVNEKELVRTPLLRDAIIASPPIVRGNESYMLAVPNPAKTPHPSIFEPRRKSDVPVKSKDEE